LHIQLIYILGFKTSNMLDLVILAIVAIGTVDKAKPGRTR